MIELFLSGSTTKAQISDEDLDLCFYKWSLMKIGYVKCSSGTTFKSRYLHLIIADRMKITSEKVDHADRNKLNCTRSNLRPATNSQSATNAAKHGVSGFRGVDWHECGKWRARIRCNNVERHLGLYKTAEEAAKAYNKAAVRLHGSFAILNFEEIPKLTT